MATNIKTTGQLREFLVDMMLGVQKGTVAMEEASRITKLAAQINESFYSEVKVAKLMLETGRAAASIGGLPINNGK